MPAAARNSSAALTVLIFASDRGLAGAFSSQVLREAEELSELLRSQGKDVVYFLFGRKAVAYFGFRRRASERIWTGGTDQPKFETAKDIGDALLESFLRDSEDGGVDEVDTDGLDAWHGGLHEPRAGEG